MTLYDTTEGFKKASIGGAFALGGIVVLFIMFRIGVYVKDVLFPPKVTPPTLTYGNLPAIQFPDPAVSAKLIYTINTSSGSLPDDFPDRVNIFPIVSREASFEDLDEAKQKARAIGMYVPEGEGIVDENKVGESLYQWVEKAGVVNSINRKFTFNTVTSDFTLRSTYNTNAEVLQAQNLSDEESATNSTKEFLDSIALLTNDIDLEKVANPTFNDKAVTYYTRPRLFKVNQFTGMLEPVTNLSDAQIIRVDLYQKDITYTLNTGLESKELKFPILYAKPPFSNMHFLIASAPNEISVVEADFLHQQVDINADPNATYPIKTAEEAFNELKDGRAYIPTEVTAPDSKVIITDVFLAYYLGDIRQQYAMPIIVFQGEGFFAYISAVKDQYIDQETTE